MAIRQLSLTDFRNLHSATLDFNPHFNLISGDNGSGKTSLLEAIYVLCRAHSFRTHQLKQCINHDKNGFPGYWFYFDQGRWRANGIKQHSRLDFNGAASWK